MTHAEMLAEIAKATAKVRVGEGPTGVTTVEMAKEWGVCTQVAWRRMERLLADGKIRYLGKSPRPSKVTGEWRRIPVYGVAKK